MITSIQNPSHESGYEFEEADTQFLWLKCILLFYVCSTFAPCVFHHGEVFVQPWDHYSTSKGSYSPGVWAVMVLTLRFADIDCAWLYRASRTLSTSFGNKDTLLILHKCIQDETQTYKNSELHGHKPEAVEEQSKCLSSSPPPANTGISARSLGVDSGCSYCD